MTTNVQLGKIIGNIILTILWICCFLFISPTLVIDFGGGILAPFKFTVVIVGLLVIVFYNIFYRSSGASTKLGLTVDLTLLWMALIVFYPFNPPATLSETAKTTWPGGAVGFFTLIGGLAITVLWVYFFADEIS
ncbi:MAG TPA: hypothetical protein VFQ30_16770 [Ktedonobacteraceae bacterium]|nr:hypothetical protein [Ktedonobacteraceae bacterium]